MYEKLFSLEGKHAVVTGGNGYLGAALARAMADFGADVAVADLEVREQGHDRISSIACDVSDTGSIRQMFKETADRLGGIDILINCATYGAGYGPLGTVERMSDDDWQKGLDGAAGTVFRCTREVIPYLERSGGGSIVNFGSMYGIVSPDPSIYGDSGANNPANYGAGKAAVIQFTRYCAAHLAGKGIRVNSVTPGPFPNPHIQQNEPFLELLGKKTMLGRAGKAEEIVGAVVFLASGASSYMTGSNIVVDGGWTAW
ncbi:SDR family oxidoreductase [Paenibacillus hemerocallicola]|uniref:SDR family oxidoreductase n=1 Tax=Paenibacillus hemerocallicola TaxID=1172614 RepID=A0A5C4TEW8_9BACL|nr:SDR family oxidoreductase [Paenibacillus hemerocallicola]TNJ67538.1 SDR family oxidoreductase [Paenibacillus hemerocallicola]